MIIRLNICNMVIFNITLWIIIPHEALLRYFTVRMVLICFENWRVRVDILLQILFCSLQ